MTPNSQSNLPLGNGATPLFADPFTGATSLENKWTVLKAGTSKSPGLTAGDSATAPATGGIPGFATPAIDAAGSGTLRLTDNTTGQSGAVIYNQSVFSKAGISIEFEYFQYGGTAVNGNKGDGISFFLIDGSASPTQAGGFGGGLGYAQNNVQNQGGIAGGYLGIGFDAFGNFGQASEGRIGGVVGESFDRITVRGSAGTAYKYLTSSAEIAGGIDNGAANATRANSGRLVRIEVAADGKLTVKFDLNGNKTFEANESVINAYDTVGTGGNSALPDSVKFGFAASTGDATNTQEIRELKISSIADLFTGGGGTTNYTAGAAAAILAPSLTVNTVVVPTPTSTFNGATVEITPATYKNGQDFLTVGTVTNNIPATSGTFSNGLTWAFNPSAGSPARGVLTISGAGTPAQYEAALKQVAYYNNAGATANTTDRTAQYTLTGIAGNPSTTSIIKVAAGNAAAKRPEILFRDFASDRVALWAVNETGVLTGAKYLTFNGVDVRPDKAWNIVDTGDIDKDGISDLLWHNTSTTETAIYFMGNEGVLKAATYLTVGGNNVKPGPTWTPVGLADLNNDGNLDNIVWRNASADQVAYWTIAGTGSTSGAVTGFGLAKTASGADFKIGDTSAASSTNLKLGNFDGIADGTELLINNKVARFNKLTATGWTGIDVLNLPSNGDASLVVRTVGDYNQDGTTDIAWESSTADKQVLQYLKLASGTTPAFDTASTNFKNLITGVPLSWYIGASKDFNADITPDLVWQDAAGNGEVAIWAIDKTNASLIAAGTSLVKFSGSGASVKPGTSWKIFGADDFGTVTLA